MTSFLSNISSLLGIESSKNDTKTTPTKVKQQYVPKQGEFNYKTDSTHDLSNAKSFKDTLTMASAGKAPTNVDYSNYNDFNSIPVNPDFSMPTIGSKLSFEA